MVYKAVTLSKTRPSLSRDELTTIRNREHRNIVPLYSSFEAGTEWRFHEEHDEDTLYMIYPRAEMDLAKWMATARPSHWEDRRVCIGDIMSSLISGLAYIHQSINGVIAFHHDIKPANVLQFLENGREVWKICDFGTSRLKLVENGTGTRSRDGTNEYAPPEVHQSTKEVLLGRSWDVWSLACIFLELATLWCHGWENDHLGEFKNRRKSNTACCFPKEKTNMAAHDDPSFYNNMNIVREWIEQLRRSADSKMLTAILDLISQMFCESRRERILAWEVKFYLISILDPGASPKAFCEEDYNNIQPPSKDSGEWSKRDNPLRRAKYWNMGPEFERVMNEKGWRTSSAICWEDNPDRDIHPTFSLPEDDEGGSGHRKGYSQDPSLFANEQFFERDGFYEKIQQSFERATRVGLYGFWGMG